MNDNINSLISKSQIEVWGSNPHNGEPEFEGYELDSTKFAELIIKECGILADEYNREKYLGNINPFEVTAYEFINKYFGVK